MDEADYLHRKRKQAVRQIQKEAKEDGIDLKYTQALRIWEDQQEERRPSDKK